jgi:hypothetical protein
MLMLPTNVARDASEASIEPDAGEAGERLTGRNSYRRVACEDANGSPLRRTFRKRAVADGSSGSDW